jgi:hypothetical protein
MCVPDSTDQVIHEIDNLAFLVPVIHALFFHESPASAEYLELPVFHALKHVQQGLLP